MKLTILALDISSTHIGLCYDGQPLETWHLHGDIAERCRLAAAMVRAQLWLTPDVDLVVIESPVARYAKALIPQARVSGAVLAVLSEKQIAWQEISPSEAKRALCGRGTATKADMIDEAGWRLGQVCDEHQSDAYALWLAARALKAEKVVA